MFLNKKSIFILITLTLISISFFLFKNPIPPSDKQLKEISDNINKSLPININDENILIGTVAQNIDGLKILDFIVLINIQHSNININDFNKNKDSLIASSCNNEPTKSLLNKSTSIRYRYISVDKINMPIIAILPRDCKSL